MKAIPVSVRSGPNYPQRVEVEAREDGLWFVGDGNPRLLSVMSEQDRFVHFLELFRDFTPEEWSKEWQDLLAMHGED